MLSGSTTILELTEAHPGTIQVLVDRGFPQMRDAEMRRKQGRLLTLAAAAKLKKLDLDALIDALSSVVEEGEADVTLAECADLTLLPEGDLRISGLLPCPVRLPLLELVRERVQQIRHLRGRTVGWSLAAASVGADGLNGQIAAVESEDDLPEIFISAGFESFFDQKNLARFKSAGVFTDIAPPGENAAFEGLGLRDPEGHFTMLGVVPAVFLVNGDVLGDEPAPRSWKELLEPRFEGRVALPVGDFDLFNGMLLTLHAMYGDEAVAALGRNMLAALHPSQTVGRFAGRQETPAVSIIPWFFGRMTLGSTIIRVEWPEDGAIVSPIFMLVRQSALDSSRELAELFLTPAAGEVLSHRGRFPVLDPAIDNQVPEGGTFAWIGWDRINAMDIGEEIPRLNAIFDAAAGVGA